MRWHGRRVQVYAYTRHTDMRKGFAGLCALVTQGLHHDPLSGDIFVFVSRDRIRAKTLQWDLCARDGYVAATCTAWDFPSAHLVRWAHNEPGPLGAACGARSGREIVRGTKRR